MKQNLKKDKWMQLKLCKTCSVNQLPHCLHFLSLLLLWSKFMVSATFYTPRVWTYYYTTKWDFQLCLGVIKVRHAQFQYDRNRGGHCTCAKMRSVASLSATNVIGGFVFGYVGYIIYHHTICSVALQTEIWKCLNVHPFIYVHWSKLWLF